MVNQPDSISFSEVSKLAHCEMAWDFEYHQGLPGDTGRGLRIGTDLHAWLRVWWGDDVPLIFVSQLGEERDTVTWLIRRWIDHYGTSPEQAFGLKLIATEYEGRIPSPVPGVALTFHIDVLAEDAAGGLWVVEEKSYASRDRLGLTNVTLQETLYVHAAQQSFPDREVAGVLFLGVYTQRWKPKKRTLAEIEADLLAAGPPVPTKKELRALAKDIQAHEPGVDREPAESFDKLELVRSQEQIDAALVMVERAIYRRDDLRRLNGPLVNLGNHCRRCAFRGRCWSDVLGQEDYGEVILDEDDGEAL